MDKPGNQGRHKLTPLGMRQGIYGDILQPEEKKKTVRKLHKHLLIVNLNESKINRILDKQ